MLAHSAASLEPRAPAPRGLVLVLSRAFSALHHRNFRLFWCGQLISLIGTWMQTIGQAWLVLELSHNSALELGVVAPFNFFRSFWFRFFAADSQAPCPSARSFLARKASR